MVTALLLALGGAAPAPRPQPTATPVTAPMAVVERVVERAERRTRLTLFDNRVAVLSVRVEGRPSFVRRRTLTQDEYVGYLAALTRDAPLIQQEQLQLPRDDTSVRASLTMRVGPGPARTVVYTPLSVAPLPLSRLNGALDDLEEVVRDTSPSEAALEAWEPRPGDRVELWGGGTARVREVRGKGVVVLEHEGEPLVEAVPPEQRATRIRRVLPPDR